MYNAKEVVRNSPKLDWIVEKCGRGNRRCEQECDDTRSCNVRNVYELELRKYEAFVFQTTCVSIRELVFSKVQHNARAIENDFAYLQKKNSSSWERPKWFWRENVPMRKTSTRRTRNYERSYVRQEKISCLLRCMKWTCSWIKLSWTPNGPGYLSMAVPADHIIDRSCYVMSWWWVSMKGDC